MLELVDRLG